MYSSTDIEWFQSFFPKPTFIKSSPSHCASRFQKQVSDSITTTHGVEETFPEKLSHGYITTTSDVQEMSVQRSRFLRYFKFNFWVKMLTVTCNQAAELILHPLFTPDHHHTC